MQRGRKTYHPITSNNTPSVSLLESQFNVSLGFCLRLQRTHKSRLLCGNATDPADTLAVACSRLPRIYCIVYIELARAGEARSPAQRSCCPTPDVLAPPPTRVRPRPANTRSGRLSSSRYVFMQYL